MYNSYCLISSSLKVTIFVFRLNDVIEEIENGDFDSDLDIVLHPPNNGSSSDAEDGGDDNAHFHDLPSRVLQSTVELGEDEPCHSSEGTTEGPPRKRPKIGPLKLMKVSMIFHSNHLRQSNAVNVNNLSTFFFNFLPMKSSTLWYSRRMTTRMSTLHQQK